MKNSLKQLAKGLFSHMNVKGPRGELKMNQMAAINDVDRRKSSRVRYPVDGPVGQLPVVIINGEEYEVVDISLGGLCIEVSGDDRLIAGESLSLTLKWDKREHQIQCDVVGQSLGRRHIQFEDLPVQAFVQLNLYLKPGLVGKRLRKVTQPNSDGLLLNVEELWVGSTGESLAFFHRSEAHSSQMHLFSHSIITQKEGPPVYNESKKGKIPGQKISLDLLERIIVLLSNVENPSLRLNELISGLFSEWKSQKELYSGN